MDVNLGSFQNLRAVELFYLMWHSDEECWIEEDALTAILTFFFSQGYVREKTSKKNNEIIITPAGIQALSFGNLRPYDKDILAVIREDFDYEEIIKAMGDVQDNLEGYLVNQGLLVRESRRFLFFFKKTATTMTYQAERLMVKSEQLKIDLSTMLEDEKIIMAPQARLLSAFPSLISTGDFDNYAEKADDNSLIAIIKNSALWSAEIYGADDDQ